MPKLLVINPKGEQEIIDIHQSGGYYDESKILYDERKSGSMPQDIIDGLGGVILLNGSIIIDQQKALEQRQAKEQKELEKENKKNSASLALSDILNVDETKNLSAAEIQAALKAVIKYLKNKEK